MPQIKRRNFCDINPTFYAISQKKEIFKRHFKDLVSKDKFAKDKHEDKLPVVISQCSSQLIKTGKGIDPVLQQNKAVNINIAGSKINKIVIHPGEVFSFWRTVGDATEKKGYLPGRVIRAGKLIPGVGGGLCNLGNTINRLVLHSPLKIVEFHTHSDALAPDHGKRVPLANGTSVSYNYIDYRFKNTTDCDFQLLIWCDKENLYGELRSEKEFENYYTLSEENHHFQKEGNDYYRVSKIYKNTISKSTDEVIKKELVWDNHSLVMFDHSQIPKEQIV